MSDSKNSPLEGVRIAYLCLQVTKEGQASYAHVHEIVGGMRNLGGSVDLYEPTYPAGVSPGVVDRLRAFRTVQSRLKRELTNYDLLYVRGHALAYPSSKAAEKLGIPVIQECNGMVEDFFIAWPSARVFAPIIRHLTLSQFRRASAVVAGSPGLASWLKRSTGRDASIVPNGANVDLFKPVPRSSWPAHLSKLPVPQKYAIFFGSLAPWQGVETMLEAAASTSWPDDIDLLVIGSGIDQQLVISAATTSPRIHYIPSLPYADLGPIISGSLCSLVIKEQPEFKEAGISPLKLYESFACGAPVIGTTEMPGLTEVIEDHDLGITIPQYNPQALAKAVSLLDDCPEMVTDISDRTRAFAVEYCSWERRAWQTTEVVLQTLSNTHTAS